MTELLTVVSGGFCVGCGACAAVEPGRYRMSENREGELVAEPAGVGDDTRFAEVCPFADEGPNEDELADELFGGVPGVAREVTGQTLACYAGHVAESSYRRDGSSGGLASWVLCELLATGAIDAVVHVQEGDSPRELFRFGVSRSVEEVRRGAKSRYYPVEMSRALQEIRSTPGRYAVVGVPCFVKAVRRAAKVDPVLARRIKFCFAIFCGHLKSKRFADAIACEAGVEPGELRGLDFRHKVPGRPANQYAARLTTEEGVVVAPMNSLQTGNWGVGLFKLRACDYCDDVFGEVADLCVGDAWLPEYVGDSRGANVCVVRHPALAKLLADAIHAGRLEAVQ